MSALQLSITEKIRKVTTILPPASLSAIIITPYPKEFPEVEELYAIIQGGRTIRNEIHIAVSTTEFPFSSTAITTRSSGE